MKKKNRNSKDDFIKCSLKDIVQLLHKIKLNMSFIFLPLLSFDRYIEDEKEIKAN
ncbi:hypothetical protein M899_0600 [Bacteriovorax sp. BSW11_IV]|nr:hypothetical protein M899_0600 [Bacteriovorax sp. BSW11_IV]